MKYNEEHIGKMIKTEREKNGMKQKDLADLIHVTNKQISNYERGILLPPLDKLLDICQVFDCELGYLLGEEGYENKTKLMTAVSNSTGLTMDALQSILNLVTDRLSFDSYRKILNRLFTAPLLEAFLDDLSVVDNVIVDYESVYKKLEKKYDKELLKKAWKAYQDPHIDFQHDEEYRDKNPDLLQIIVEIDTSVDDMIDKKPIIDVARYHLNKTMEALVDEMYPLSKYRP